MVEGKEENTGIREKRKWERKNNDIRVVLKARFVKKKISSQLKYNKLNEIKIFNFFKILVIVYLNKII